MLKTIIFMYPLVLKKGLYLIILPLYRDSSTHKRNSVNVYTVKSNKSGPLGNTEKPLEKVK